ncbi:hypothetical protein PR048_006843 [Dryococelus australis]|uniref:Uncharacterized protein n=1 Tax=Dryococelus australis TaxID=614101 RepID=A0ABQ9ID23_9NEOP|nr:hypothetical protein PR048_006843 [Dryococelus australis]
MHRAQVKQYDPVSYKVGDLVLVKTHHLSRKVDSFSTKLGFEYDGPYCIVSFITSILGGHLLLSSFPVFRIPFHPAKALEFKSRRYGGGPGHSFIAIGCFLLWASSISFSGFGEEAPVAIFQCVGGMKPCFKSDTRVRCAPGAAESCPVATTGNEFSLAHSGTFHTPLRYSRRLLNLPERRFRFPSKCAVFLFEFRGLAGNRSCLHHFVLRGFSMLDYYNKDVASQLRRCRTTLRLSGKFRHCWLLGADGDGQGYRGYKCLMHSLSQFVEPCAWSKHVRGKFEGNRNGMISIGDSYIRRISCPTLHKGVLPLHVCKFISELSGGVSDCPYQLLPCVWFPSAVHSTLQEAPEGKNLTGRGQETGTEPPLPIHPPARIHCIQEFILRPAEVRRCPIQLQTTRHDVLLTAHLPIRVVSQFQEIVRSSADCKFHKEVACQLPSARTAMWRSRRLFRIAFLANHNIGLKPTCRFAGFVTGESAAILLRPHIPSPWTETSKVREITYPLTGCLHDALGANLTCYWHPFDVDGSSLVLPTKQSFVYSEWSGETRAALSIKVLRADEGGVR